jgi:hypothetical protein
VSCGKFSIPKKNFLSMGSSSQKLNTLDEFHFGGTKTAAARVQSLAALATHPTPTPFVEHL